MWPDPTPAFHHPDTISTPQRPTPTRIHVLERTNSGPTPSWWTPTRQTATTTTAPDTGTPTNRNHSNSNMPPNANSNTDRSNPNCKHWTAWNSELNLESQEPPQWSKVRSMESSSSSSSHPDDEDPNVITLGQSSLSPPRHDSLYAPPVSSSSPSQKTTPASSRPRSTMRYSYRDQEPQTSTPITSSQEEEAERRRQAVVAAAIRRCQNSPARPYPSSSAASNSTPTRSSAASSTPTRRFRVQDLASRMSSKQDDNDDDSITPMPQEEEDEEELKTVASSVTGSRNSRWEPSVQSEESSSYRSRSKSRRRSNSKSHSESNRHHHNVLHDLSSSTSPRITKTPEQAKQEVRQLFSPPTEDMEEEDEELERVNLRIASRRSSPYRSSSSSRRRRRRSRSMDQEEEQEEESLELPSLPDLQPRVEQPMAHNFPPFPESAEPFVPVSTSSCASSSNWMWKGSSSSSAFQETVSSVDPTAATSLGTNNRNSAWSAFSTPSVWGNHEDQPEEIDETPLTEDEEGNNYDEDSNSDDDSQILLLTPSSKGETDPHKKKRNRSYRSSSCGTETTTMSNTSVSSSSHTQKHYPRTSRNHGEGGNHSPLLLTIAASRSFSPLTLANQTTASVGSSSSASARYSPTPDQEPSQQTAASARQRSQSGTPPPTSTRRRHNAVRSISPRILLRGMTRTKGSSPARSSNNDDDDNDAEPLLPPRSSFFFGGGKNNRRNSTSSFQCEPLIGEDEIELVCSRPTVEPPKETNKSEPLIGDDEIELVCSEPSVKPLRKTKKTRTKSRAMTKSKTPQKRRGRGRNTTPRPTTPVSASGTTTKKGTSSTTTKRTNSKPKAKKPPVSSRTAIRSPSPSNIATKSNKNLKRSTEGAGAEYTPPSTPVPKELKPFEVASPSKPPEPAVSTKETIAPGTPVPSSRPPQPKRTMSPLSEFFFGKPTVPPTTTASTAKGSVSPSPSQRSCSPLAEMFFGQSEDAGLRMADPPSSRPGMPPRARSLSPALNDLLFGTMADCRDCPRSSVNDTESTTQLLQPKPKPVSQTPPPRRKSTTSSPINTVYVYGRKTPPSSSSNANQENQGPNVTPPPTKRRESSSDGGHQQDDNNPSTPQAISSASVTTKPMDGTRKASSPTRSISSFFGNTDGSKSRSKSPGRRSDSKSPGRKSPGRRDTSKSPGRRGNKSPGNSSVRSASVQSTSRSYGFGRKSPYPSSPLSAQQSKSPSRRHDKVVEPWELIPTQTRSKTTESSVLSSPSSSKASIDEPRHHKTRAKSPNSVSNAPPTASSEHASGTNDTPSGLIIFKPSSRATSREKSRSSSVDNKSAVSRRSSSAQSSGRMSQTSSPSRRRPVTPLRVFSKYESIESLAAKYGRGSKKQATHDTDDASSPILRIDSMDSGMSSKKSILKRDKSPSKTEGRPGSPSRMNWVAAHPEPPREPGYIRWQDDGAQSQQPGGAPIKPDMISIAASQMVFQVADYVDRQFMFMAEDAASLVSGPDKAGEDEEVGGEDDILLAIEDLLFASE